jgi:uncharacterized protein YdhG (YjbR/CyaY superfamily)
MTTPASVDDYLAALPDESRAVLEDLRRAITAAAPTANETTRLEKNSEGGDP